MDPNMPNPQGENTTPQTSVSAPTFQETPPSAPPVEQAPVTPPATTPTIPPELMPTKKTSPVLIVVIVLMIIGLLAVGAYVFSTKFMGGKATPIPIATSMATEEPLPTPTPDPMADWKTYLDTNFLYPNKIYSGYSFLYSPICTRTLATLACKFATGTGTITVNAGGKGGPRIETRAIVAGETKTYPFGEGKLTETEDVKAKTVFGTFWITKTPKLTQDPIFGFEFTGIPTADLAEFDKMFDSMLTTFKFVEATSSPSPRASGSPSASPSSSPTTSPVATP